MAAGILLGGRIASRTPGHFFLRLDGTLGAGLCPPLPLGASFGDLRSQPDKYGGVGLGTANTSGIFSR